MSETSVSAEDFAHVLGQVRRFVRRDVVPREKEIMSQDRIPDDLRVAAAEMVCSATPSRRSGAASGST